VHFLRCGKFEIDVNHVENVWYFSPGSFVAVSVEDFLLSIGGEGFVFGVGFFVFGPYGLEAYVTD